MASTILFKSKLEPWRIIGFGLLALLSIPSATALYLAYFTDYASHLKPDDQKGIFVIPWVFLAVGAFALYMAIRNKKTLLVDKESIHIGSRIISYTDVKDIDVLARNTVDFWGYNKEELVIITTTQGNALTIRIENYSNGNEFRAICQKIKENIAAQVYQLNSFTPPAYVDVRAISFSSLSNENFEVFRSHPFRYMALLYPPFLWVLAIATFVEVQTINNSGAIILVVVGVFMVLTGVYMVWIILSQQNRFLLSSNYLVIKSNVNLASPVIPLNEIKRITPNYVYTGRGMPRGDDLLIITSDYRVHTFGIPASYTQLQPMIDKITAEINN